MKVYKLTNQDMQTHGGCQWTLGKTKKTDGKGDLCGPGWLHAYEDKRLAMLVNPIHAMIKTPRMLMAVGSGESIMEPLKCGFTKLKPYREIRLPRFTLDQRVYFAILCALEVAEDESFSAWANNWISGQNRSHKTARATAAAMAARAMAARAMAAAAMAVWVMEARATAAAMAARAAAMWAERTETAMEARAAAMAAEKAAADAADTAAHAADATKKDQTIDFAAVAKKAAEFEVEK